MAGVAQEATSEGQGFVLYPDYRVRFRTRLDALPSLLSPAQQADLATYDAWQKRGYVFLRDFFQSSAEALLESHYAHLRLSPKG